VNWREPKNERRMQMSMPTRSNAADARVGNENPLAKAKKR